MYKFGEKIEIVPVKSTYKREYVKPEPIMIKKDTGATGTNHIYEYNVMYYDFVNSKWISKIFGNMFKAQEEIKKAWRLYNNEDRTKKLNR